MKINLLSYNIRYDNPLDGVNIWDNRKMDLCALIAQQNPSIFCIQEAQKSQKDFLEMQFPNFGLVGVGRSDGWENGEMVNIFYDKNIFEKLENGDFWLSDTPELVGSCTWGNRLPRLVSWIKLQEKTTNNILFVFNTHFDHESLNARQKSVTLLHQKVQEIAGNHLAFITGDFNLTPSESTYKMLKNVFFDTKILFNKNIPQTSTFNNFGTNAVSNLWIDYIFSNQKDTFTIENFEVIDTKINNRFPSDHFAILIKIEKNS